MIRREVFAPVLLIALIALSPLQALSQDGACCRIEGTCQQTSLDSCGGLWLGLDSVCGPPVPCCIDGLGCQIMARSCCDAFSGVSGEGQVCGNVGKCCHLDGTCGPSFEGCCDGSFVESSTCFSTVSCCLPDANCADMDPECCALSGGVPGFFGSACLAVQACCIGSDVSCRNVEPTCCASVFEGSPVGDNTLCETGEGACCFDSDMDGVRDSCDVMSQTCCIALDGDFNGNGTFCEGQGACCLGAGDCSTMDRLCCTNLGGVFKGFGTACAGDVDGDGLDDLCVPPMEPCPLPAGPAQQLCAGLQDNCMTAFGTGVDKECRPRQIELFPGGDPEFFVRDCSCVEPGSCGEIQLIGSLLTCGGTCLGGLAGDCEVYINGEPTGLPSANIFNYQNGDLASCECPAVTCCNPTAQLECFETRGETCLASGGSVQPGSICQGPEACCFGDFCAVIDRICCASSGGTPQGPGSTCQGTGICCLDIEDDNFSFETCREMDGACCQAQGGVFAGPGESCDQQACCLPHGGCRRLDPECCFASGGYPQGPNSFCGPDANGDGITDSCACQQAEDCCGPGDVDAISSNCKWCDCVGEQGTCLILTPPFADVGGEFGDCLPDGFCNLHDRIHTLRCFSGVSDCNRLNLDVGGEFGSCCPDSFCNLHDALHTMACFAGLNECSCPVTGICPVDPGPAPEMPTAAVDSIVVALLADARHIAPGDKVTIDVYIEDGIKSLQGYQLHMQASGGSAGHLNLHAVQVKARRDYVFAKRSDALSEVNVSTGQMLALLDYNQGVAVRSGAYLATFSFVASGDAIGDFVIDLRHDRAVQDQTFFVAPPNKAIDVMVTRPVHIQVKPQRRRAQR